VVTVLRRKEIDVGDRWILYGANGYTGRLIAEEAARRGHEPILAARRAESVEPLAKELGFESRVFALDDPDVVARAVEGAPAVLHAAGPFIETSRPMVDACLAGGAAYLDITGEIAVFESIFARDDEAKRAGVALVPGVGFDVVPTDCIAATLADALPGATSIDLAFCPRGGGLSRGTRRTMIRNMPGGGAVRREGKIVDVPTAWHDREIEFSCGTRRAMTIPWGDVSTAYHSTGIPNVRVYLALSSRAIARARRLGRFNRILGFAPLRQWLLSRVPAGGPDERARETGRVFLWGEARTPAEESVVVTAETPEGYTLTAIAAVRSVERVLAGEVAPGAHTPSRAFGKDFLASIEGVRISSPEGAS